MGLVIHRYGRDLSGGAEAHCRTLAQGLARRAEVEVITTTAQDYTTWANEYLSGQEQDGEVKVLRFPVAWQRNVLFFDLINRLTARLSPHQPGWLEKLWLLAQGPHCPGLLRYLKAQGETYDRIIFYTYLYEPTVLGLGLVRERAWLIPTAHDEPALGFKIVRPAFEQAQGLGFLSPKEAELVKSRFNVAKTPSTIIAAGVEAPAQIDAAAFRAVFGLDRYLLYLGRVDHHKGIPQLLDLWAAIQGRFPGLTLVLAGEKKMDLSGIEGAKGVLAVGFLGEEAKWSALAGATALIAPSALESLNLTVLEAGAVGRPVLVNAASPVLVDYVQRSRAGLIYSNAASLTAGLEEINQPQRAEELGQQGREMVEREFAWPVVEPRLAIWLGLE
ncbi:MAG: glycosyltransferase family 4 protein [Deltaproteobacteria bacterium]|nr:glycosyltransferase family 4 protein [Deltaproteobacteria bacterium]